MSTNCDIWGYDDRYDKSERKDQMVFNLDMNDLPYQYEAC